VMIGSVENDIVKTDETVVYVGTITSEEVFTATNSRDHIDVPANTEIVSSILPLQNETNIVTPKAATRSIVGVDISNKTNEKNITIATTAVSAATDLSNVAAGGNHEGYSLWTLVSTASIALVTGMLLSYSQGGGGGGTLFRTKR
jgi:hypothetical protein